MSRYKHYQMSKYRVSQDTMLWWTIAAMAVAIIILSLLGGCAKAPQVAVEVAPGQYQLPVAHKNVDLPAGWEKEAGTARIVINPTSLEPIVLNVRERPRSLAKKLFPSRSATTVDVVSSSKAVTVTQEPKIPWWYYAIGIIGGAAAVKIFLGKYLGLVGKFASGAWSLIVRIFKK